MNYNSYPQQGSQHAYYQNPVHQQPPMHQYPPVHQYPSEQPAPPARYCNLCNFGIDPETMTFWHCSRCASGDFDMCDGCMRRGGQCFCGTFNGNIEYQVHSPNARPGTGNQGPLNQSTAHTMSPAAQVPGYSPQAAPTQSTQVQNAEAGEQKLMALLDQRLEQANANAAAAEPAAANQAAQIHAAAGSHLVTMQHLQLMGMQHSFNMGGFGGLV